MNLAAILYPSIRQGPDRVDVDIPVIDALFHLDQVGFNRGHEAQPGEGVINAEVALP